MNRVKHSPNLFLCRPTSFSQCRKLFVDKPIRLRAVSLFARGVRVHACASIEQRSRETRDTRNSPVTHLQSHACLRRSAPRTKKKETARSLQTNGHKRALCNKNTAIMPRYETVPQQGAHAQQRSRAECAKIKQMKETKTLLAGWGDTFKVSLLVHTLEVLNSRDESSSVLHQRF